MKRKAFYLSTSLNLGGTEKYLLILVENLSQDYDFTVGYLKEKGDIGKVLEQKGVKVVHFTGLMELVRFLKESKFDFMQTFLFRANILGRIAGKLAGVPVIISTQQAIDDWKSFYHSWIDGLTSIFCDMIIANSQTAKDLLIKREKISSDKITVINNGIDFNEFKPSKQREALRKELGISKETPVILYLGRLHKEKGADFLPEIARNTGDAVMLVAGDGPEKNDLNIRITEMKLLDKVRLLGWRRDVADLLNASDIFIVPSREESFPQVILDAMYLSIPVVAYDVGGVKELVENGINGLLIEPLNINDFCNALNSLLKDTKRSKEFGMNGRKKASGYSQDKLINSTKAVYESLTNGRTR